MELLPFGIELFKYSLETVFAMGPRDARALLALPKYSIETVFVLDPRDARALLALPKVLPCFNPQ